MTRQRFVWLGLLFALVFATASSLRAQQQFTFQKFSIPQNVGALSVSGINDFGTTSGDLVDSYGNTKGWVRDPFGHVFSFVEPRNTAPPIFTRANGINDLGIVAGDYFDNAANTNQGYFLIAGKFQTYTVPNVAPGTYTTLDSLNNFGSFCGFVGNDAFVSINGKPTMFSVNDSSFTFCESINDLVWSAGAYLDNNSGVWHGWIRNPAGVITTYDAPGASTSVGTPQSNPCNFSAEGGTRIYGINDHGEIAGHFWDNSFVEHGFVLPLSGNFTQIDVPGAISTSLGSLNNLGQVDGHYVDSQCNNLGYIATPKSK